MTRRTFAVASLVAVLVTAASTVRAEDEKKAAGKNPQATITTSLGVIEVELYQDKAPVSVENFVEYAKAGFYDGTTFHRVIPDFMIQGGGLTPDMNKKPTRDPIKNEADNGLQNTNGTLAMARTSDPNSATAQFFINVKDNTHLDHRDESPAGYGYAVFGKVTKGMDVVEKIEAVKTSTKAGRPNVPVEAVVIEKVTVSDG